jgi:predicted RNase H-like nuclease (RuvC/YqgF family)
MVDSMSAVEGRVSNNSLQRQISALSSRLDQVAADVSEIKAMLKDIESRVRKLENYEAGSHPLLESKIDAAWRKIDEHDKKIDNLTQIVSRLDHSNRLMAWLGGILGSTVLIWLVTQILQAVK